MSAGGLRHRVTFQVLAPVEDTQGGRTMNWTDSFETWAAVEYLTGRELVQAQQMTSSATVRIRMRFRAAVVATMQAIWLNAGVTHTFKVESYKPADVGNVEMHVMCSEVQP
jgi:SPP1 family predicted phage head-tail adaptor